MTNAPPPLPTPLPPPPLAVPSIRVGGAGELSIPPGTTITSQGEHPSAWLALASQLDAIAAVVAFAWWASRHVVDPQTAGALIIAAIIAARRGGIAGSVMQTGIGVVSGLGAAIASMRSSSSSSSSSANKHGGNG